MGVYRNTVSESLKYAVIGCFLFGGVGDVIAGAT